MMRVKKKYSWVLVSRYRLQLSCSIIVEKAVERAKTMIRVRMETRAVKFNLQRSLEWALVNSRDEGVKHSLSAALLELERASSVMDVEKVIDRLSNPSI
jgi:hypothetical protein